MNTNKTAKNTKELIRNIVLYNTASILGPLVLFVGTGLILDNIFKTNSRFTFLGVVIAFFLSNYFLYKKIRELMKYFNKIDKIKKEKKQEILNKLK